MSSQHGPVCLCHRLPGISAFGFSSAPGCKARWQCMPMPTAASWACVMALLGGAPNPPPTNNPNHSKPRQTQAKAGTEGRLPLLSGVTGQGMSAVSSRAAAGREGGRGARCDLEQTYASAIDQHVSPHLRSRHENGSTKSESGTTVSAAPSTTKKGAGQLVSSHAGAPFTVHIWAALICACLWTYRLGRCTICQRVERTDQGGSSRCRGCMRIWGPSRQLLGARTGWRPRGCRRCCASSHAGESAAGNGLQFGSFGAPAVCWDGIWSWATLM